MIPITIAAKDVRIGDYIHNSKAEHEAFKWERVVLTRERTGPIVVESGRTLEGRIVEIHTHGWYTVKHADEGIAVVRKVPA